MIKLQINNKEKLFTNKDGLKILQKNNPKEKFRIAFCKEAKCYVVQQKDDKEWLCLHD